MDMFLRSSSSFVSWYGAEYQYDHTGAGSILWGAAISHSIESTLCVILKYWAGTVIPALNKMSHHPSLVTMAIGSSVNIKFALTINLTFFRFSEGIIVRNTMRDGDWGAEERQGQLNLVPGQDFHIKVWTNPSLFYTVFTITQQLMLIITLFVDCVNG